MTKRTIAFLIAGVLILGGFGTLLAQQGADDAKFTKIVNAYLEEYWKFYPTAATLAGFGKFDNKIEDFSESAVEKRGNAIDAVNAELTTKITADKLSPDFQIDRQILLDSLDYELFRLESLVPQEYNPFFYNEIFLHGIRGLLVRNFSDAKLTAATERAKALPGFIKFAKANLKTPPPEYTQAAIDQMPAILAFYKNDLVGLIPNGGPAKDKFMAEAGKVIAALEDWSRFLQNDLMPKSTGNFRLGPEAHARLLRLTGQTSMMTDEFVNRSKADYNNIRREMAMVCIPFYRIMYPNVDLDKINAGSEDAARNMIIKGVLDKIKGDHIERNAWVDKVKETAGVIRAFIEKTKLLDIPAATLAIEPMESIYQGMTWLKFFGPATYENTGDYKMQVQPIPGSWPEDQAQSFLEEFNNFYLNFWTVERIYPGMFFPAAAIGANPSSIIRKMAPVSQPLLAGWPLYTEEMFINAGFGEYDLRLRLNQLKLQLKAVIDFQMELNVHQGNYTKEQVVNYMTRGGFMTEAEAERKWQMLILNPGYSYYPYAGYQEILDIEKDYKAAKGAAFDQKEFLNKLTSFGPLPIRLIKTKISQ